MDIKKQQALISLLHSREEGASVDVPISQQLRDELAEEINRLGGGGDGVDNPKGGILLHFFWKEAFRGERRANLIVDPSLENHVDVQFRSPDGSGPRTCYSWRESEGNFVQVECTYN